LIVAVFPRQVAAQVSETVPYDHIHLAVPDPEKAYAWYAANLDGVAGENPGRLIFEPFTGRRPLPVNLMFLKRPDVAPSEGSIIESIGFSVADVDARVKRLEAAGGRVAAPGVVVDPWGVTIELVDDRDYRGFHHVSLRVPDVDAGIRWFLTAFGGERVTLQGRLDAVRYDRTFIVFRQGKGAPSQGRAIDHLGWMPSSIDALQARLKAEGVTFTAGPSPKPNQLGHRTGYVEAPGGARIELVEHTDCTWGKVRSTAAQPAPFATPPPGSPPAKIRPYGEAGGCPEEPALFHRCALEKAKTFEPPRTPDGRPDFQGVWTRIGIRNSENIEEHPETMDGSGGRSAIVDPADGYIPYQPWASAKRDAHFGTYLDPPRLCVPQGAPRFLYSGGAKQVIQTPGYISMFSDQAHNFRLIPTDGGPHVGARIRLFEGDPRGRWEGNTLVIDVTNQNAIAWLDHAGNFYSPEAHVVERLTMIDRDVMHVSVTITDPNVYTRPWTMAFGWRRTPDSATYEQWEQACWEGVATSPSISDTLLKPYPGFSR
jgi:catechol 2,3-dioxygenase-like lactoylglutathione lyase family enzyme